MNKMDSQFVEIWNQKLVPVLFRREKGNPLLVRLPKADNEWLRGSSRKTTPWNKEFRCREVPVSWFDELIKRLIRRYGKVYVIQVYKTYQRCVPACWNAKGIHCECSCMGANHGSGHPDGRWYTISKTSTFDLDKRKYAFRLISKKA